jgi:hypothetical protein
MYRQYNNKNTKIQVSKLIFQDADLRSTHAHTHTHTHTHTQQREREREREMKKIHTDR